MPDLSSLQELAGGLDAAEGAVEEASNALSDLQEHLTALGYTGGWGDLTELATKIEGVTGEAFTSLRGQLDADLEEAEAEEEDGTINPETGMVRGAIRTERGGKPTG